MLALTVIGAAPYHGVGRGCLSLPSSPHHSHLSLPPPASLLCKHKMTEAGGSGVIMPVWFG